MPIDHYTDLTDQLLGLSLNRLICEVNRNCLGATSKGQRIGAVLTLWVEEDNRG